MLYIKFYTPLYSIDFIDSGWRLLFGKDLYFVFFISNVISEMICLVSHVTLLSLLKFDVLKPPHSLVVGANLFNKKIVSLKVETPKAGKRAPFEDCFAEVEHEVKVGYNLF